MITELHLKNFQAHKNKVLKFTEGVNIIRGSSDSGKSAIIRAMIACITGKDFNSAYQTWGTSGPMEVSITIDGHTITRGRDAKSNYYLLDGKRFVALRGECPKEISDIFNINADQLNSQYDSFFLLSDTAGGVAKKIQAVCDLDSIAKINKAVTKSVNDTAVEERMISQKLADLEPRLKKLDSVVVLRRRYQRLLERKTYIEEQESLLDSYEQLKAGYEKLVVYENLAAAASLRPDLDQCVELLTSIKNKRSEREQLIRLQKNVERLSVKIERATKAESILKESKSIFVEIQKMQKTLQENEKRMKNFENLKMKYEKTTKAFEKAKKELKNLYIEREELFKEIKICPLCGANL